MAALPNRSTGTGERPIEKLLGPLQRFTALQASGGLVLMVATAAALAWANSPWGDTYRAILAAPFTVGGELLAISKPLVLWINDGLMALFFFVVGLEIKREILYGELSTGRKAILPIVAAVGGMVVPASIYAAINAGGEGLRGWGIPMATDIAFALGILALCGSRVPFSAKVFLTALAIIDDLGAVLVIALFYTEQIGFTALAVAVVFLAAAAAGNVLGVRRPIFYLILGLGCWVATLKSGVHATVAGVLLAMTIPGRRRIDLGDFVSRVRGRLAQIEEEPGPDRPSASACVDDIETSCERVQEPMQRMEHSLHPWSTYFVVPVFALANAGVALDAGLGAALTHSVTVGILLGLVVGKLAGVTLACLLAVKLGLATLPEGMTWRHVVGAGWLAGIGFTMSLFIAGLAFPTGEGLLELSKVGILGASLVAGVVGWLFMRAAVARASA